MTELVTVNCRDKWRMLHHTGFTSPTGLVVVIHTAAGEGNIPTSLIELMPHCISASQMNKCKNILYKHSESSVVWDPT